MRGVAEWCDNTIPRDADLVGTPLDMTYAAVTSILKTSGISLVSRGCCLVRVWEWEPGGKEREYSIWRRKSIC
jgi:hypothetical protein